MLTFEKLRIERGLSVDEVEKGAGIPNKHLIGIETGRHKSAHGLWKLATYFNVDLSNQILSEYGVIVKKQENG
jgi:transcriptional regulator with XRE-family HTH domain